MLRNRLLVFVVLALAVVAALNVRLAGALHVGRPIGPAASYGTALDEHERHPLWEQPTVPTATAHVQAGVSESSRLAPWGQLSALATTEASTSETGSYGTALDLHERHPDLNVVAQESPLAVYLRYFDANARGDVTGVMSLYADDAVFSGGGGCRPTPCVGKAAIQRAYENMVTDNYRYKLLDTQVAGTTVSFRAEVVNNATLQAGVERIITAGTAEVQASQIVDLRAAPVPNDAQTARFVAWQAQQTP